MGLIYIIRCIFTVKVYIGLTTMSLAARWNKHRSAARKYKEYVDNPEGKKEPNGCTKLYKSMAKHGIDSFQISIVEEVNDDILGNTEVMYIAAFDSVQNGYNLREGGGNGRHSQETIEKIRIRTKEYLLKNLDKIRTFDIVKGMPPHCVRIVVKGSEGVAINNHPLCKKKCFTIRKYGSIDAAKDACREFLINLEAAGIFRERPKIGANLPKGLRKIKDGYAVQKIHEKKLYYKSFTQHGSDQLNLDAANQHLNKLLDSWNLK